MRKRDWVSSMVKVAACAGGVCGLTSFASAGDQPGMRMDEVVVKLPSPALVDDAAGLELGNKLGLNTPANPGDLRGLPTCPTILTDTANCHIANLTLGANFSGTNAGAFRTMDNVTVVGQNPDRLCWIGRYANRVNPAVADESFQIRIFADNGGFPDLNAGPIYTNTFAQSGAAGTNLLELSCLDGETCPGTTNPAAGGHWVFSAQVNGGFPMNAGGCYWIEIANVGSAAAGVQWGWVGSQLGTDLTSMQAIDGAYTAFTRAANDRAMCVSGGVDPLTGGCVIGPLPPVCTNPTTNGNNDTGATVGFRASSPGSTGRTATPGAWTPFRRADNFQFGAPAAVTNVCFWGFWLGVTAAGGTVGIAAPAQPAFDITYFSNVDGVPGAPLPMADFTVGDPGVTMNYDGTELASVTHPAVNFQANQCYWVSIGRVQGNSANPNGDSGPLWHWYLAAPSNPTSDDIVAAGLANNTNCPDWSQLTIAPANPSNLTFLFDAGGLVAPSCPLPPPPPPPANDLCANLIAMPTPCQSLSPMASGTTAGATMDGFDTLPCGGATAQSVGGVWYTTVGNGSNITASACGTMCPYDGQISVFTSTGGCNGPFSCVTGDDDFCGGGGMSQVTFASTQGETYYILMHGWAGEFGTFTLTLTSDATCQGGTDCNQNGTPDNQEIAGNPALDCWNAGSPSGVTGGPDGALDVCQCTGNFNRDGAVNSSDISSFLTGWLASVQGPNTNGDINCSGSTNSSDISSFLTIWLANVNGSSPFDGCP